MIFQIVLGLIIWLVIPPLVEDKLRRGPRKAVGLLCKIVGIAIVLGAVASKFL